MLTSRQKNILQKLLAQDTPVTGKYLGKINQVTSRTIREDIKGLGSLLSGNGAYIYTVMGQGYELIITNESLFRNYLQKMLGNEIENGTFIPKSPEERITYLIKRLLLIDDYIKLDDLADEMYVSKSTIQNDLIPVRNILSAYDIHLESRPNYGMKVRGEELQLRFCIAEHIFDRNEEKCNPILDTDLTSLSRTDLETILEIIMGQIKENHLTLSDIAINNLFIHIAIAYKRIKSGNHVTIYQADMQEILEQKEYQVAKKIVRKIEEEFQIDFPEEETAYIAIHLLGIKMLLHTNAGDKVVEQVMEDEISEIVTKALDKIESELNLGIKEDKELILALSLHLKPAINRFKYGMNIRNPMLADIKKNYPLAFEAGIIASLAIEKHTGTKIDENEVGYLALHIGAAIERRKLKSGPKRCLIVCASGLGTAQLIFYKLKSHFGKSLDVVGTTEYYNLQQYNLNDIDFIISSIPIPEKIPVPVIEVNAIIGDTDINKIEREVLDNKQNFNHYFRENLTFLRKKFGSKKEVLEFLSISLIEKGLVDNNFLDALNERECVAPTSYGNLVAVPHPISPRSEFTFLTVCTLDKPIIWKDKPVQFVCLLSVKKNSMEDLQDMYDGLGKITENASIVQRLIKAKTHDDFMKIVNEIR